MKIGIFCNFGPPHVGGSEQVIESISTRLIERYGYNVSIYAFNYKKESIYKGISLVPCKKGNEFISQINSGDVCFVYSDSFWNFDYLVNNAHKIDCRVFCALVGCYNMKSNGQLLKTFQEVKDKFTLITHSETTCDYKWCIDNNLPVNVIFNGISLSEFDNSINFREKYEIKEKYVLFSPSNYFYGKGQGILPDIYRKLSKRLSDFNIVQVSNSIFYRYDPFFLDSVKRKSQGLNIRFLRDLPREDIIAAFKCSDVFLFTSLKEISPLVILESRAAGLPFVSLNVGDIGEQSGGITIQPSKYDNKGYVKVDGKIIEKYCDEIFNILTLEGFRDNLIKQGREGIEKRDWDNIVPLYEELFRK